MMRMVIKKHQLKQINYSYWFLRSKNNFILPQKTLTSYSVLTILSPLSTSPNEQEKSTATSESIPFFDVLHSGLTQICAFVTGRHVWSHCSHLAEGAIWHLNLGLIPWFPPLHIYIPTLHMLYSPKWSCIHSIYIFVKLTI